MLQKKIAYPFIILHSKTIHHPKIFSIYYDVLYKKFVPKLFLMSLDNKIYIYIFFKFLPRIILLLIFILDIFLFQKIQIFYYFLPINIILLLYIYITTTLKNSKEYLIQRLEFRYYKITLEEKYNDIPKSIWKEIIDAFGPEKYKALSFVEKSKILIYNNENSFFIREEKVKHNPNAIHHSTNVSIRKCLEILEERHKNYDEDDMENAYIYICDPSCHDHIYREYEKIHNLEEFRLGAFWHRDYDLIGDGDNYRKSGKITNIDNVILGTFEKAYDDILEHEGPREYSSRITRYEKITEYHKKELEKDFYEITEILKFLYYILSFLENVENKRIFKYLNIILLVLTLICWMFILGVSTYVFPPDFLFTLSVLYEQHPQYDPFSMLDLYNNYRGYCLVFDINYTSIFHFMYNKIVQNVLPIKLCIVYMVYKFFTVEDVTKERNVKKEQPRNKEYSRKKKVRKKLGLTSSKNKFHR